MRVNTLSSEPLYLQIQQLLMQEIRDGRYDADGRLPSERELSERFKVSRMTARQALQGLLQKGWVYTRTGKGTYIRKQPFRQDLAKLTSFSEDMRALGVVASSKVLRAGVIPSDKAIAARLGIQMGSQVARLQRLRLANGQPVAIETCYLVDALCPDILRRHDFARESLYQVLQQDYAFTLARADQTIRAGVVGKEEAQLLAMAGDTYAVALCLNRVTYTQHDRPIEYVYSLYHAGFYEFHASLHGAQARMVTLPTLE